MLREAIAAAAAAIAVAAAIAGQSRGEGAVPLLNITTLLTSQPDRPAERALRKAAASSGVLRVVGHGVDVDGMLDVARRLFSLPEDDKLAASGSGGFSRGYIPIGGESGLAQFLELKEGFCYGWPWEQANATPSNPIAAANTWPPLDSSAKQALLAYFEQSIALSSALSRALAGGGRGELTPAEMAELLAGGETYSLMRLFRYLPADREPQLARGKPRTGSSPHTDWHVLTVILQDRTGGLQVRDKRGKWHDVPALAGELIVLVGDYMSALSGGVYHAPVHRVLLPEAGLERYSYTLFHYPRFDATVPLDASRRASKKQRRLAGGTTRTGVNTLVPPGQDLTYLSEQTFGNLLHAKWLDVVSNRA
mmetsp:Transcript_34791/g.86540  ORF Transcript_34791/g.86540 Transcript_34791/m.86540 type:complete len:365 (+) Transcript_34791:26-1120(+)